MNMAEAYAPMLSKASKEEVALQTLKLLRANKPLQRNKPSRSAKTNSIPSLSKSSRG